MTHRDRVEYNELTAVSRKYTLAGLQWFAVSLLSLLIMFALFQLRQDALVLGLSLVVVSTSALATLAFLKIPNNSIPPQKILGVGMSLLVLFSGSAIFWSYLLA